MNVEIFSYSLLTTVLGMVVMSEVKPVSRRVKILFPILTTIASALLVPAEEFLTLKTIMIIALGLAAFVVGTAAGTFLGKLMYVITKGRANPMIGSANAAEVLLALAG